MYRYIKVIFLKDKNELKKKKKIEKRLFFHYFVYMQNKLVVDNYDIVINLLGQNDEYLKIIQSKFNAKIIVRGNEIKFIGEKKELALLEKIFKSLISMSKSGKIIHKNDIFYLLENDFSKEMDPDFFSVHINIPKSNKKIIAKTKTQAEYLNFIKTNDIVVGVGPAGTGKTYLAMAYALENLLSNKVKRIILTRPVVEVGESLGFLPGNLEEKVNPYLRPLYDAIFDMIDFEKFERLVEKGSIEIAPLAYMRGRTLHDAFIILDEAQNTTSKQMQMFLTRLGISSKIVITGDISQIDLPSNQSSGLIEIIDILKDIDGIKFVFFKKQDVVRHDLVKKIIDAYENMYKKKRVTNNE